VFGKEHRNVTAAIKVYIEGGVLGFQQSDYTTDRGKTYPMYEMTRKAFMILRYVLCLKINKNPSFVKTNPNQSTFLAI